MGGLSEQSVSSCSTSNIVISRAERSKYSKDALLKALIAFIIADDQVSSHVHIGMRSTHRPCTSQSMLLSALNFGIFCCCVEVSYPRLTFPINLNWEKVSLSHGSLSLSSWKCQGCFYCWHVTGRLCDVGYCAIKPSALIIALLMLHCHVILSHVLWCTIIFWFLVE